MTFNAVKWVFFLTASGTVIKLTLMKTIPPYSQRLRFFFRVLLALPLFAALAQADDGTWTGGGTGSGDPAVYGWDDAGNWADGDIAGGTSSNTDTATFGDVTNRNVLVDDNRVIGSINFTLNEDSGYTFSGATLGLSHGGALTQVSHANHTFNNDLVLLPESPTLAGVYTITDNNTSRNFTFNGNISGGTTTAGVTLILDGIRDTGTEFRGVISDGGAEEGLHLVINNTWAPNRPGITLIGDNTYTGGTTLFSSRTDRQVYVRVATDTPFGTGLVTGNRFWLVRDASSTQTSFTFANDFRVSDLMRVETSSGGDTTFNGNIILDPGTSGEVTFIRDATYNGVISEADGPAALRLPSIGSDGIIFNAANTFSGGLILAQSYGFGNDSVRLGPNGTVGTGPIVVESAGAFGGDDRTLPNAVVINGVFETTGATIYTFTGPVTIGSETTHNPALNSQGSDSGGMIFRGVISDGGNNQPLRLNRGTFVWAADNALTGTITVERVTLQIGEGGSTGLIGSSAVVLGGQSNAPAVIFDRTGSYTVENAFSNSASDGGGTITFQGGGTATLTGTSTWTPHGDATNALVVANGTTVLIDGSHTAPSGNYVIQSGATLGGSGSIDLGGIGSISITAGSFLAPGSLNSAGTLNIDAILDLSLLNGDSSNLIFRLGSVSDQIVFGNNASILGELNFGDFDFVAGAGFGGGTYDLFVFDDVFNNALFLGNTTTGTINGLEAELFLNGSSLSLTVIPEPATVAAILGAMTLGLVMWRRRTRAGARVMTDS